MISCWAKITTRKVRNWARSVTGSGQEFGFSRSAEFREGFGQRKVRILTRNVSSRTPVSPTMFLEISKGFSRLSRGIGRPFMMMFES